MNFTFELTKQDYLDFNMFTVKNYKFYKTQMKLFRGIFTIIPIGTGLVNLLLNGEKRIGVIVALLIVMTLISILFWCGFPKFYDALMLRNAKKILFREGENHVLGKRTLFFEEDKIQTVTEYEESYVKYAAITQIKQSDKAIYLYTAPAMILPIRFLQMKQKNRNVSILSTQDLGKAIIYFIKMPITAK